MTKQSTKAYNDRNVYVLGAGFSVKSGLPVMRDFMNRMRDAAAWLEEQGDRQEEVKAIGSVLDFRLSAPSASYRVPLDVDNIEELFSLASARGSAELSEQMTLAIAGTIDFCTKTAPARDQDFIKVSKLGDGQWEKPQSWKVPQAEGQHCLTPGGAPGVKVYLCPTYQFFLGLMCGYFSEESTDRRDTVISLNYDTVVEGALWALGLPFCYANNESIEWRPSPPAGDRDREPIPVLKLHGSVNVSERTKGNSPVMKRLGIPVQKLAAFPSYPDLRKEGLSPTLVPPSWHKALGGYLWQAFGEAVSALETATRVIIMGYSVPQTDQDFRYLLAAGLQQNISLRKVLIVNSDEREEFQQRIYSLFRKEHFKDGSNDGLIEKVPLTVEKFLLDLDQQKRIQRTFKKGAWSLTQN